MKLTRLQMTWFRQFKSADFDFNDGLTCIVGANGAGKSTIVEAVAYALFGPHALRGKIGELTTWGAPRGAKAQVTLDFEIQGRAFQTTRSLSGATLQNAGGQILANGARETADEIERVLGLRRDELYASLIAPQKGLEWMSGSGATDRRRFLSRVLGFERLRDAAQALRNWAKADELAADRLRPQTPPDFDLEEARERLDAAAYERDQTTHERTRAQAAYDEADQALQTWQQGAEGVEVCRRTFAAAEASWRSAGAACEEAGGLVERAERYEANALEAHAAAGAALQAAREEAEVETRDELMAERERMLAQAAGLKAKAEAINEAIATKKALAESGNDVCDACGAPINSSDLAATIQALQDTALGLTRERDAVIVEGKTVRTRLEAWDAAAGALTKAEGSVTNAGGALKRERERLDRATETLAQASAEVEAARDALARAEEEWPTSKRDRLVEVRREARAAMTSLNEQLASIAGRIRSLEGQVDAAQRAVEADILRQSSTINFAAEGGVRDLTEKLNDEARPRISRIASEIIRDMSEGRFTSLELSEKYEPVLYRGDEAVRIPSGGEADLANLALRIAVSSLISSRGGMRYETLLLDEVLGSLDESRQRGTVEALRTLVSSGRFRQVVLISHTRIGPDECDHLIEVEGAEPLSETAQLPVSA